MKLIIKSHEGEFEVDTSDTITIGELVEVARKHFKLQKRGHYVLGKFNHVSVEFMASSRLSELCLKDNDVLIFENYTS